MKYIAALIILIALLYTCTNESSQTTSTGANYKDMEAAQKFLDDLPPACKNSRMATRSDGTIIVYVLCEKAGTFQGMDGRIEIKDGKVRKVE